jgi:hypothetical protein
MVNQVVIRVAVMGTPKTSPTIYGLRATWIPSSAAYAVFISENIG